jgi:hypothetical protein
MAIHGFPLSMITNSLLLLAIIRTDIVSPALVHPPKFDIAVRQAKYQRQINEMFLRGNQSSRPWIRVEKYNNETEYRMVRAVS